MNRLPEASILNPNRHLKPRLASGALDAAGRVLRRTSAARTSGLLVVALFASTHCGGSTTADDGSTTTGSPKTCERTIESVTVDAVHITRPEAEAAACVEAAADDARKICEPTALDLSCLDEKTPLGTPLFVTFHGCVEVFGLRAASDDLSIALFEESHDGVTTDPGYDLNGAPGTQANNTPAALIGKTISVKVPESECPEGGAFTIEHVPTETPLIARVTDQHKEKASRRFVDTYQYNVILRNSGIVDGTSPDAQAVATPETTCATSPCYVFDRVNAIQQATFFTVSVTAGAGQPEGSSNLYDGVGKGHIAGEIQDCTSKNRIMNASVAFSAPAKRLTYFNVKMNDPVADLDNPQPDTTRATTNADGLYAGISLSAKAGGEEVEIGAVVRPTPCGTDGICRCEGSTLNSAYGGPDADGSEDVVKILGVKKIRVFPDSITILTFDRSMYTTP